VKVFSNTTPFISLASIDRLYLLPELFKTVCVAEAVVHECLQGGPIFVPDLRTLDWIEICQDRDDLQMPALFELDKGEKQTILSALGTPGSLVIMDEKIGRNMAEYLGLKVVGTLGLLVKAKRLGLVQSFRQETCGMIEAGIRYNPQLIETLCSQLGE
jgi:hypothetical protein